MMRGLMAIASSLAEITKSLAGKNKSKRISVLYPAGSRTGEGDEAFAEPCCADFSATTDVRFGPNADIALFNETPALQPSLGTVLCAHSSTQNAE